MAGQVRIAIIGSGPAGLSAATHAAKLGLSHVLLEKADHLSDTIYKYQRGKHIMATPVQLVLRSDARFEAGQRERLLEQWDADAKPVNVTLNAEVMTIAGAKGAFVLTLKNGGTVTAETIVLAIGTQGNPNLLRIPGDTSCVQYQLDDPAEYIDENIVVIGGGDAGIENALGLIADPEQKNIVSLIARDAGFPAAKAANVSNLMAARDAGRITTYVQTTTTAFEDGCLVADTPNGPVRVPVDRVIARMGSAPPRKWVESFGVEFASSARNAYPSLSPQFETSQPGIFCIGALAGYPLIKHCMNQGYDVVEFINGNAALKPADEPILAAKFAPLGTKRDVGEWLAFVQSRVPVLAELSPLQMREYMIDAEVRVVRKGDTVFARAAAGASLYFIVQGAVAVEVDPGNPARNVLIPSGQFFGEVGLISGQRRGAAVRTVEDSVFVELERTTALKLMTQVTRAKAVIDRVMTERQLLQVFGPGLTPPDLAGIIANLSTRQLKAGEALITEGEAGTDLFVIRSGSCTVDKTIGGKSVFLSYVTAGSFVGEMAVVNGGVRSATVRATVKTEVVQIDGPAFHALLAKKPDVMARLKAAMASRQKINDFVAAQKESFGSIVDLHTETARFMVANGLGEATDVLLIDETLCIGCDNCEKACADTHDGLSRLDRESGKTFAHLHVPTSCRHCEHPHCMSECPPNAISRGPDGEVRIDDSCIGCGNCVRFCPYGVIRLDKVPPKKPPLLSWLLFGAGPGPGEPSHDWADKHRKGGVVPPKRAVKCDMCAGIKGGASCVRACPTGAAIRVSTEFFGRVANRHTES